MRKQVKTGIHVGASSLLVIFVLLCLVTFAVLSLVSASADQKLSAKAAEHTTDFYQASNRAEHILGRIDDGLAGLRLASENREGYFAGLPSLAASLGEGIACSGETLSYSVSVSENQRLSVVLLALYPEAPGEPYYQVTQWKLESSREWTGAQSAPLYGTKHETGTMEDSDQ